MNLEGLRPLPSGLQITPDRFILFSDDNKKVIVTFDNMTWTTYAVLVSSPAWINCDKRFMLEAQSTAEFEVEAVVNKALDKNEANLLKFSFVDMANKDATYQAIIELQYHPRSKKQKNSQEKTSLLLLHLSLLLLFLSFLMLLYHYRYQVQYYTCVFQHSLCKISNREQPFLKKVICSAL